MPSILFIDDEKELGDALGEIASLLGYTSIVVSSAAAAFAVIGDPAIEPMLVFCDQHMPGTTGVGVLKKIRQENIRILGFVLMTANLSLEIVAECSFFGCDTQLTKPFGMKELERLLTKFA